jgi:hypothetical protein
MIFKSYSLHQRVKQRPHFECIHHDIDIKRRSAASNVPPLSISHNSLAQAPPPFQNFATPRPRQSMDVQETIRGVQPLVGEVRPIRTVQETQPVEEYGIYTITSHCLASADNFRLRIRRRSERQKRCKGCQVRSFRFPVSFRSNANRVLESLMPVSPATLLVLRATSAASQSRATSPNTSTPCS